MGTDSCVVAAACWRTLERVHVHKSPAGRNHPQPDLAHTLRRWQDGGIVIQSKALDTSGPPVQIEVRKPSGFGLLWHRALRMLGLRRHRLGGFGGFVPEPSAG